MDPIRNPFAPGAGSQPPELAGRDDIISAATISLQRVARGKHAKSLILSGLRGTGKTVLLNKIEQCAEHDDHITSFLEAPDDKSLSELLYPKIHQVLRKLSNVEKAKAMAHQGLRALRSFAGAFKISVGNYSVSVDPETGVADSGNLEYDLTDLFVRVGKTAQAANTAWSLFIDELQYVRENELAALIVALHRAAQKALPVILFGAGLPQIAGLSGKVKSYSERLFYFPHVGPLDKAAAIAAIRQPVEDEAETISDAALDMIFEDTQGYPYFLQEWGYQAWDVAAASPIGPDNIKRAAIAAIRRLDEGFFRVRYDRLTPKERDYVNAMAALGPGPYRSSDIAEKLGENIQSLGPRRAQIIHKGMIYSPAHGEIAFTVPKFEKFLKRNQ